MSQPNGISRESAFETATTRLTDAIFLPHTAKRMSLYRMRTDAGHFTNCYPAASHRRDSPNSIQLLSEQVRRRRLRDYNNRDHQ